MVLQFHSIAKGVGSRLELSLVNPVYTRIPQLGFLVREAIIAQLRKNIQKCKKLEDYVNLAFSFELFGVKIKPIQVKSEILTLLKILMNLRPRAVLEIGTAYGGGLFLLGWF